MAKENKEKNDKEEQKSILSGDIKKSIGAVILITLALIFILSLIGKAGLVGQYVDRFLATALGWGRYGLPILMLVVGAVYFKKLEPIRYYLTSIGAGLFLIFLLIVFHLFFDIKQMGEVASKGAGGGYLGLAGGYLLTKYLGTAASFIVSIGGLLVGFILTFNFPLNKPFYWIKEALISLKARFSKTFEKEIGEEKQKEKTEDNIRLSTVKYVEDPHALLPAKESSFRNENLYNRENGQTSLLNRTESEEKNRKPISNWNFSDTSFLDANGKKSNPKNLQDNAEIIKKTLHDFGIEVEISGFNVGPTVVQYTFKPAVGVHLSKILNLQSNIALNLAASSVRIEAPIPGRSLVGIEVPLSESEKALVRMKTMLESDVFKEKKSNLSIILGEDVNGDIITGQMERMPHLLIAGSTNTGKSVCINSILIALLYQNSPDDMKLILVDPKRVELSLYDGIPHLLTPVITDNSKVVPALKWVVEEMENRYRCLQEIGARDIYSYNEKAVKGEKRKILDKKSGQYRKEEIKKLPFIIIVIDELADLMVMYGREIEAIIIRLAQMARAVGIHLIVSTQRPSVNVVTGIIKANITTRIAFQVATQVDSRTILDGAGAEKLLGNGDMLYSSTQSPKPRRIQGVYISEREVNRVVKALKREAARLELKEEENEAEDSLKEYLERAKATAADRGSFFPEKKDELIFEEAKRIVLETGKASTTFLQRKLGIGYPKAANIMDMLEEHGIVSPQEGSKSRHVLMKEEAEYKNPEEDQEKREEWQE